MPAADKGALTDGAIPLFFLPNPVTGREVALPAGAKTVGYARLLPNAGTAPEAITTSGNIETDITEAQRRLSRSTAYDGVENISHAFGNYIDDFLWKEDGALFAKDGWRGKYLVGFYSGPDHVEQCERIELGDTPNPRHQVDIHWRTQPVIEFLPTARTPSCAPAVAT